MYFLCQDLTTLGAVGSASGPGNILVSAGVRVLKVPKRRVIELSPRGHMETFEENFNPKHRLELFTGVPNSIILVSERGQMRAS